MNDKILPEQPLLWLQAVVHEIDSNSYALEVRFQNLDEQVGSLRIERALIREPWKVVSRLLDAGAVLPEDRKAAADLVRAALHGPPVEQYAITKRGGWHDGSYVTRTETFGDA